MSTGRLMDVHLYFFTLRRIIWDAPPLGLRCTRGRDVHGRALNLELLFGGGFAAEVGGARRRRRSGDRWRLNALALGVPSAREAGASPAAAAGM